MLTTLISCSQSTFVPKLNHSIYEAMNNCLSHTEQTFMAIIRHFYWALLWWTNLLYATFRGTNFLWILTISTQFSHTSIMITDLWHFIINVGFFKSPEIQANAQTMLHYNLTYLIKYNLILYKHHATKLDYPFLTYLQYQYEQ